jgi:hypothetical protein
MLWSRPMPLGWYFAEQWRRFFGNNWVEQLCDKFIIQDRFLKNFANELPVVSQHYPRILLLNFLKNFVNELPVVSQHSQNFAYELPVVSQYALRISQTSCQW